MFAKELKKCIVFPPKKRAKRGLSFFERALRHAVDGGTENRNLSKEIDKILYGAENNHR
jgi:hypothetical protein